MIKLKTLFAGTGVGSSAIHVAPQASIEYDPQAGKWLARLRAPAQVRHHPISLRFNSNLLRFSSI